MRSRLGIGSVLVWLFAAPAFAVPVNPYAPDGVAAVASVPQNLYLLMTSGEMISFHLDANTGAWTCREVPRNELGLPPIPFGSIRDWDPVELRVMTVDFDLWALEPGTVHWIKVGSFADCVGPVGSQPTSIGGLKSLFR